MTCFFFSFSKIDMRCCSTLCHMNVKMCEKVWLIIYVLWILYFCIVSFLCALSKFFFVSWLKLWRSLFVCRVRVDWSSIYIWKVLPNLWVWNVMITPLKSLFLFFLTALFVTRCYDTVKTHVAMKLCMKVDIVVRVWLYFLRWSSINELVLMYSFFHLIIFYRFCFSFLNCKDAQERVSSEWEGVPIYTSRLAALPLSSFSLYCSLCVVSLPLFLYHI